MTIWEAIIEGIIQGATEFLPVSSSGHLSLSQHFLGIKAPGLLFDVLLHVGTLIAVLLVYYKLIWRLLKAFGRMVRRIFTGKFQWSKMDADENMVMMLIIGLIPLFLLFLPVPGTGNKVKDIADQWANDGDILIEGFALIVTSVLLTLGLLASRKTAKRHMERTHGGKSPSGRRRFNIIDSLCVGLGQVFAAVFPGLSRSGTTLSVGLLRGINRQAALDYSFVIGIPSILAAAVLELKDIPGSTEEVNWLSVLIGVAAAAVVGFFAIKLLRWMVASDKLMPFIVYTLVLGAIVVVLGIIEHTTGMVFSLHTGA